MMAILRVLTNRRVLISIAVIAILLAVALWPKTTTVEVATPSRGSLVLTVDEEGRTRVRDRFVVAAPVAGRVLRIELDPGDSVTRGMVVARVQAEPPPLLDARSRAEAEAAIEGARATLGRAKAEEQRARATLDQAQRELNRTRELIASELTTARELDSRAADVRTAEEALNANAFAVRAATSDLARAQARLAPTPTVAAGRVVTVTSPVNGLVLKRVRESEAVVPAGDPLLEIGNPQQLEIVADLLSTDAVQVKPGARALIDQWGGTRTLDARVKRVEPSGFTKISALGVEEQRVNVILDFVDPAEAWAALGDGYRVEVRIVVWEASSVVRLPTSTLFRSGDRWATYVVSDGRAHLTFVEIGHQTGQQAEVLGGLSEGARVIVHPADTLVDAARVTERTP